MPSVLWKWVGHALAHLREEISHLIWAGLALIITGSIPDQWLERAVSQLQLRRILSDPIAGAIAHSESPRLAVAIFGIALVLYAIYPRASAATSRDRNISIVNLPATRADIVGRATELAYLEHCWSDPGIGIVTVVGLGGAGKSALVNRWLRDLKDREFDGAERVFAWSFHSQGTTDKPAADLFTDEALRWFGVTEERFESEYSKARRLANCIREHRSLLVLDGLEPFQYPPDSGHTVLEGGIKDEARAIRYFLKELASNVGGQAGLCLISSRLALSDLVEFEGNTLRKLELPALRDEDGARLLRRLGVLGTEAEMLDAARDCAGHAFTLTILGGYLVDACDGNVRRRKELGPLADGRATRIMKAYESWFENSPQDDLLRLLGLFDRPVEPSAMEALLAPPPILGLTERLGRLGEFERSQTIATLRRASLLTPDTTARPHVIDAHPLVREYFSKRLQESHPLARKIGHERLCDWALSQCPQKPSTILEMAPAMDAITHACEAGDYLRGLRIYRTKILQGGAYFSTYQLGAHSNEIAILRHFFVGDWVEPVPSLPAADRAFILRQTGYCQRARGIPRQALRWLEESLAIYDVLGEREQRRDILRILSSVCIVMGELANAEKFAHAAIEIADRSADAFERLACYACLADVMHHRGSYGESLRLFEISEAIVRKSNPTWYLYGYSGFKYMDLLLSLRHFDEVKARAQWTLSWVRSNPGDLSATPFTVALAHLALGRRLLALGDGRRRIREALHHLDLAYDHIRASGRDEMIVLCELAKVDAYLSVGQLAQAHNSVRNASAVVDRGDMKLYKVDCLLKQARIDAASGARSARSELQTVEAQILNMGYLRKSVELHAARAELARRE